MSSELDYELLELVGGASSDKEKQTRKRKRDASSSSQGKASSTSSKKREIAHSENGPESEDGDESEELYPLEGKYLDEEDREVLLGKTEIEREEILAARLDEMERIRDRKHVDELRARQLAGVAAVESEANHKRALRATGKDKTKDRTLNALKLKRQAKDEKKRTRGNSHKHSNERSSSPMEMIMSDFEDGQISTTDGEDERLLGKPKSQNMDSEPAVELPLTSEHLQQLALTREMLAKHSTSPWFEKIVVGMCCCWVRYFIGHHESKPVYRICEIKGRYMHFGLAPAAKPYNLNPDKITHQIFELKHGKAERAWQMDHTSNEKWTSDEFKRLQDTCKDDKVLLPSRKEVDERLSEMQVLISKPITETDINVMMARKRQLAAQGTSGGSLSVVERSRLIAQRTLAQRRQDYNEMREIDERLVKMGESGPPASEEDVPRDRLTLVSERNRKANMEAVRCAELAEVQRKRRERKSRDNNIPTVNDPSARRRTIPRLCESATPTSRPERLNPAMSGTAKKLAPAPAPKWNGNAIWKTFEEVIESIEVDLGEF